MNLVKIGDRQWIDLSRLVWAFDWPKGFTEKGPPMLFVWLDGGKDSIEFKGELRDKMLKWLESKVGELA